MTHDADLSIAQAEIQRLKLIKAQLAEEWRLQAHGIYHDHLSDLAFLIVAVEFRDSRLEAAESQVSTLQRVMREMEQRKDGAYEERNRVVAAFAWMALQAGFKAGIARTAIEGWSDDWHGCVYVEGPWGQASWHFHDSQAHLFAGLPAYAGAWDGHTTEQKYQRLAALLSARPVEPGSETKA